MADRVAELRVLLDVAAAVEASLVDMGPDCIVCGEGIETDDDPCDVPCSGWELRKAFVRLRAALEKTR